MFTGIIEKIGTVTAIERNKSNAVFEINSDFTNELKIDQSVAHNGVCLTVISIYGDKYKVEAIAETLHVTNLSKLKIGDLINLERCMKSDGRFDGHVVQGHVDETATCTKIEDLNGSWKFHFSYNESSKNITVKKGSICVNGVSLTVVDSEKNTFSVAIIPYTYDNTNFKNLKVGDDVNLEFDVIGKYVAKMMRHEK